MYLLRGEEWQKSDVICCNTGGTSQEACKLLLSDNLHPPERTSGGESRLPKVSTLDDNPALCSAPTIPKN